MMTYVCPILFATLIVGASADEFASAVSVVLEEAVEPAVVPYKCKVENLGIIDEYMIKKVGKKSEGSHNPFPYGKVFFTEAVDAIEALEAATGIDAIEAIDAVPVKLVANIYMEFFEDKLTEDPNTKLLVLDGGFEEIYINVPKEAKDCKAGGGTLLDKSLYDSGHLKIHNYNYQGFYPPKNKNTCFPSTTKGKVTQISVKIKEPFRNVSNEGKIDFCYRVGYTIGVNKELVSFKDTKILGKVGRTGAFGNFDTPVNIIAPDSTLLDSTVDKEVGVQVSLCNKKNIFADNAVTKEYQISETVRLCLKSLNDAYEVVKFTEVSCGSGGNGAVLENDSIAVGSVITAAFITEVASKDEIPCEGSVILKKIVTSTKRRKLREVSSGSKTAAGDADADDEPLETPIHWKINFAIPNNKLNNKIYIESSASLPSSIITTTVAVLSFVIALFL